MKPTTRKLIAFYVIPVLFTWLCIELGLVLLDPVLFKGFWQYDPDLGFRVRAGMQDSNRFGFNDRDHTPLKAPGTYRIMLLGDSYNWVGGRQWNYTVKLQQLFDQHYGSGRVEIVNIGYPATHTAEELGILKKYGLQVRPDMLVLGFFAGNDFFDGDPYRKRIIVNGLYMDIDPRHEMKFLGYPVIFQSRLLMLLKQGWATLTSVQHGGSPNGEFTVSAYEALCAQYLTFFSKVKLQHGDLSANINYILTALYDMGTLMQQQKIAFRVAIFPAEEQVDMKLFLQVVKDEKLTADDYDLDQVQRVVRQAAEKRHIPTLDMLPDFRREISHQPLYLPRNTHWNQAGNELAAKLLFTWLQPQVAEFLAQSNNKAGR